MALQCRQRQQIWWKFQYYISGTDNVAIGCTSATLSGAKQIAIGAQLNAAITCNNAIVLGSAHGGYYGGYSVTIRHALYKDPDHPLLISRVDQVMDYTTSLAHSPRGISNSKEYSGLLGTH